MSIYMSNWEISYTCHDFVCHHNSTIDPVPVNSRNDGDGIALLWRLYGFSERACVKAGPPNTQWFSLHNICMCAWPSPSHARSLPTIYIDTYVVLARQFLTDYRTQIPFPSTRTIAKCPCMHGLSSVNYKDVLLASSSCSPRFLVWWTLKILPQRCEVGHFV